MGGITQPFTLALGKAIASSTPTWNLVVGSAGDLQNLPLVSVQDPTTSSARLTSGWTAAASGDIGQGGSGNAYVQLWSDRLGFFLRGGGTYAFQRSYDGLHWNNVNAVATIQALAESPDLGLFVALVGATALTSPDGTTWTQHAIGGGNTWSGLIWVSSLNLFIATSRQGNPAGQCVYTSPDGINWTARNTPLNYAQGIAWSDTLGVMVADGGSAEPNAAMASGDGINWSLVTTQPAAHNWNMIAWGDGAQIFVACPEGAGNYAGGYSIDGINWTANNMPNFGAGVRYQNIVWAPELGMFLASTDARDIAYSFDGKTWTAVVSALPAGANGGSGVMWSNAMGVFAVNDAAQNYIYVSQPPADRVNFFDLIIGKATLGGVPLAGDGTTLTATGVLAASNIVAGTQVAAGVVPSPLVSGTVYQNTLAYPIKVYITATYSPTGALSAQLAIALGAAAAPATIFTEDEPAAATAGRVHTTSIVVPPSWYFSATANAQVVINSTVAFAGAR